MDSTLQIYVRHLTQLGRNAVDSDALRSSLEESTAKEMHTMIDELFPIIATADLDRALTFWQDLLGGQVAYRFPPEGDAEYLSINLGRSQLGIGVERAPNQTPTVGRISLWCYVVDCDAVVERVRAAELPVRQEPTDQPWGERVAMIEDPDGNQVFIGTKP